MLKTWLTDGTEQLEQVSVELLKDVPHKIILFSGAMGAGKTTLIKAICKQLGVIENTSSPTFALVHEYAGNETIYHFDLFRIKNLKELSDLGFAEYLESGKYVFIEWPEMGSTLLSDYNCAKVSIDIDSNLKRIITLEA